jgi:aldehyde dehydrogenase (NAD+)
MFAAIAAGNCVLLKPSEITVHSTRLMIDLVNKYLDPSAIRVVTGGAAETTKILELKYNVILYTGNSKVGRIIAAAAAKHLTPCILELGGQAPAIVTKTADISLAAKRVAHSKFMNAGQICLAANHVLVDPAVHDEFVEKLVEWFKVFFANGPREQYSRIINERQFDRLVAVLGRTKGKIIRGGKSNRQSLWIDPAVVTEVGLDGKQTALGVSYLLTAPRRSSPGRRAFRSNLASYQSRLQRSHSNDCQVSHMPVKLWRSLTGYSLTSHPLGLYVFGKDQAVIDEGK